jgi:predicted transcriptional regulator
MEKITVFSNPGTSRVFLSLVKGIKYPKAIADFLGIKPTPVIEQLKRLKKLNVVKLGEKDGREQNYDIIWAEFLRLFIEQTRRQKGTEKNPIEDPDDPTFNVNLRHLASNEYFRKFIEFYLLNISEGPPHYWSTINEAIDNFEKALSQTSISKEKRKNDNEEEQIFVATMRTWQEKTTSAKTWLDVCLHDALHKTLKV